MSVSASLLHFSDTHRQQAAAAMGDLSFGLSNPHTFEEEFRSPTLSPGKIVLSPASAAAKRLSDIHIPSPDHAVSIASSERFEKRGLVAAQQAALHDSAILEMGYQMTESEYAFMPEGAVPQAPSIGSLKDLKALKPVRLSDLKMGKVHRGRILSGTLSCKSVKTSAVMNVLEEDGGSGDATRIMIANAVPRSATTANAQRLYPEGAQLSVREPYLKRFSDGLVGLLVENPADIIFNYLPDDLPSPPEHETEQQLPSKRFHERDSGGEAQETASGQAVAAGSFSPSPHNPVGGQSAASATEDEGQTHFLAASQQDHEMSNGDSAPRALPSDSRGEIDPLQSSTVGTDDEEATGPAASEEGSEEFVESGISAKGEEFLPEKVVGSEEGGEEVAERGISGDGNERLPENVVENAIEVDNSVSLLTSRNAETGAKGDNGQEECFTGELGAARKAQRLEREARIKAGNGGTFLDATAEGPVECIKSVVEESLEISHTAEVDSGKGMPSPKANGGTEGLSPRSEIPSVVKGVISSDAAKSRGAGATADDADLQHGIDLTAAALRLLGNKYFARQDWAGAIELYTKAILKAVKESKGNSSPNCEKNFDQPFVDEPESEVVMDYSNRAEAWLRLHHYERAWADAERALALDPNHLKSLFRKGRALLGLGDYQQALAHLEAAYSRAPSDKDLLAAIHMSRIGDHQSRLGIYDLTDYYLRGRFVRETPSCADYVGPVQVKAASGDKGRGLFLTKAVQAGDLCLVSSPLAMLLESKSGSKGRKNVLDPSAAKGGGLRLDAEVEEKLVHAVRERAKVSSKNRHRLLALCHGEGSSPQTVPSMDLFIPGRRMVPTESPELDEARIHRIVAQNAIDRNMVSTTLEKRHVFHREVSEETSDDRCFYGLWVLPSFINHSCIPNVSMVVMGRALFVYASKDLSAGEELLCSYYNVFQPLPQRRELASRCWGFSCRCARCLLETRFESSLKRLYSLHTRLEPNPTFVLQFSPFGYKAPAKDLAKELEIIETSKKLDNRERSWLQASFTQLYTVSRDFMGPHGNHHYLEAALRAMEMVCPGSNSTLVVGLLARETVRKESNGRKSSQYKAVNQQVLRICQCIYGKQRTAVLQSLVDGTPLDAEKI